MQPKIVMVGLPRVNRYGYLLILVEMLSSRGRHIRMETGDAECVREKALDGIVLCCTS